MPTTENYNEIFERLVPGSGKADTFEGEVLRAFNRLVYRFYNDGDECHTGYGIETAGPAYMFLLEISTPNTQLCIHARERFIGLQDSDEKLRHILGELESCEGEGYKEVLDELEEVLIPLVDKPESELLENPDTDMHDWNEKAFAHFGKPNEVY